MINYAIKKCKLLMCSLLFMCFTACSNDLFTEFDYEDDSAYSPINDVFKVSKTALNSVEYKNFKKAQSDFMALFLKPDSSIMIYIDSIEMYQVSFAAEKYALNRATSALEKRYPEILKAERKGLYNKRTKINPSKKNNPEGIAFTIFPSTTYYASRWQCTPYAFYADAQNACIGFARENHVECGGYAFMDYSSLFITDSQATYTSMSLPSGNSFWGTNTPIFGYHTHFNNSTPSPTDEQAEDAMGFPYYVINVSDDTYLRR